MSSTGGFALPPSVGGGSDGIREPGTTNTSTFAFSTCYSVIPYIYTSAYEHQRFRCLEQVGSLHHCFVESRCSTTVNNISRSHEHQVVNRRQDRTP